MTQIAKIYQGVLVILVGSTLLLLSSCAQVVTDPELHSRYRIVPGLGLTSCKIGDDEKTFQKLFGGVTSNGYIISKAEGVEAAMIDGKIVTLFFYFTSRPVGVFEGETLEGIGRKSTLDEVIQTYGKPDKVINGPGPLWSVSPMSWYQESSIKYLSKGITFTFWDGHLADVRIYKSRLTQ